MSIALLNDHETRRRWLGVVGTASVIPNSDRASQNPKRSSWNKKVNTQQRDFPKARASSPISIQSGLETRKLTRLSSSPSSWYSVLIFKFEIALKCFSLKVYKGIFSAIAVCPIRQSTKSIQIF